MISNLHFDILTKISNGVELKMSNAIFNLKS